VRAEAGIQGRPAECLYGHGLPFSGQPLVPLPRRRTGVKIAGGTARDVVLLSGRGGGRRSA
jgi:hypothetical protein